MRENGIKTHLLIKNISLSVQKFVIDRFNFQVLIIQVFAQAFTLTISSF